MTKRQTTSPIGQNERIRELDLIRGVALLGILMANMLIFSHPYTYSGILNTTLWPDIWNQAAQWFIYTFVEYKFITMFSFLFGLGFMIFLQRAKAKGARPITLYIRRTIILLLFGVIHAYLIWHGDILIVYAVLAFFLIFFRNSSARTLLSWGGGLLIISSIWFAVQTFVFNNMMARLAPPREFVQSLIQESLYTYTQGTYIQIFNQRLIDINILEQSMFHSPLLAFAMFLVGAYAGKSGFFQDLSKYSTFIRRVWLWSLIIGVPFTILQVILFVYVDSIQYGYNYAHVTGIMIAGPALCLFYITSILLIVRHKSWRPLFAPLETVGRMALTNYLLQSVVCTFLFYSYGLGWYGQVGPALGIILALALFALQVLLSNMWLNYYQYGPLEWIWRSLTYGYWQPLNRFNDD